MLVPRKLGLSGMGPLFTCPTGEQVFSTSDCPGGQPAPDVQQQISDVWSALFAQQQQPALPAGSSPKSPMAAFFDSWGMPILVGIGVLEVLLLGGRR